MKIFIKILAVIILFGACRAEKIESDIPKDKQVKPFKGKIPADSPVISMALTPEKYTWKDLDDYYRNQLLKNEQDMDYFRNAKNVAFSTLVNSFNMAELAPQSTIAYYIEEQSDIPYSPFSDEYIVCLNKLKGYWSPEKIHEVAAQRYEKTRLYYLNSELWKDRWEKEKQKYDTLLAYSVQE